MKTKYNLGIIGHPLGHTLSPVMHQAAATELGIELSYEPFDVAPQDLGEFMKTLPERPLDGLNVTVPHKLAVMQWLDEISEEARRIGAVNTIVISKGRMIGHNTDSHGFITSLTENAGIKPVGKSVLVFGAGGAARAVVWAVLKAGAKVTIANRTIGKARLIASDFQGVGAPINTIGFDSAQLGGVIHSADIIVNTTSLGMEGAGPGALPSMEGLLNRNHLVVDIVYRPLDTTLLREARLAKASTLDGLWMLVHQGAASFKLWTGSGFPAGVARAALEKALESS